MTGVKALVLTGYGLNCDYETDYALKLAGADSHRVHINELIQGEQTQTGPKLSQYHILVFGGGFSWADDHGAGVVLASKLKYNIGEQIERFIRDGKLIMGICNGFQSIVNLGLLPGFDQSYQERRIALAANDTGNFIDTWVRLKINNDSPCVFTKGLSHIELPVRHAEGKFTASHQDMDRLFENNQVVMQYAGDNGTPAQGHWPVNPNGSLRDVAGICDPTGRVFGLMPHPEAFNHVTNHPDWTFQKETLKREGKTLDTQEGDGIRIFRNAVEYIQEHFEQDLPKPRV
ncbi:MAG: phosphoribosylformylglycinamidine synthase subunit PurQ [Deltaproteobacteria bacterium]|nr:phosphoribosylformylglycinamidine synthase subunit PurQ [Deltaproteobacteria bacterium]